MTILPRAELLGKLRMPDKADDPVHFTARHTAHLIERRLRAAMDLLSPGLQQLRAEGYQAEAVAEHIEGRVTLTVRIQLLHVEPLGEQEIKG
jgi:hypothetical protein